MYNVYHFNKLLSLNCALLLLVGHKLCNEANIEVIYVFLKIPRDNGTFSKFAGGGLISDLKWEG